MRDTRALDDRPDAANEVWATDFVHDQRFNGSEMRVLTIVDMFTRVSPAIDARQSYRNTDAVATLERAAKKPDSRRSIWLGDWQLPIVAHSDQPEGRGKHPT